MSLSSLTPMKRDTSFDAAKGIGIILVVLAHMNYLEPMKTIIYSFHMPLFFIISGMLFNKNKYDSFKSFIKRRFKTLIVPYLIFAFMSFILNSVYLASNGISSDFFSSVLETFIQIFYAQYSRTTSFNTPMWFVTCLLAVECLYFFISKIKNKPLFYIITVTAVFLGWFTESRYCSIDFSVLPWNMSTAFFALGFYAFGNKIMPVYKKLQERVNNTDHKNSILFILFAILMAADIGLSFFNGAISLGSRELNNGFLLYATGIIGTVAILSLSNIVYKSRFLGFCGKNSFYIMASHRPIMLVLSVAYKIIFKKDFELIPYEWVPSIILFIVDLAITLCFVLVYVKLKQRFTEKNKKEA